MKMSLEFMSQNTHNPRKVRKLQEKGTEKIREEQYEEVSEDESQ